MPATSNNGVNEPRGRAVRFVFPWNEELKSCEETKTMIFASFFLPFLFRSWNFWNQTS